jgi:hypothetical protein
LGATLARLQKIADSQLGGAATTWAPATWYLGLSTAAPALDGTGFVEPVGGGYTRVAITNNATNWPAATIADNVVRKQNGAKFTFPNPTAAWGMITHWGLFLASTGGVPEWHQMLGDGNQPAPISPRAGLTPVEFDVGQLFMLFGVATAG